MAFDKPVTQAALSLGRKLSASSWYSSVGITEHERSPVLIVYLRKRLSRADASRIPTRWEGIPVKIEQVGRIVPARRAS